MWTLLALFLRFVRRIKIAAIRTKKQKMFEGKYTTMGSRSTLHPRVARKELNHHLGMSSKHHIPPLLTVKCTDDVLPAVNREIRESFETILPACEGICIVFA